MYNSKKFLKELMVLILVCKDRQDYCPKVKLKRLHRHLVAACSIGHKSSLLHVNGWEMDQTKSQRI